MKFSALILFNFFLISNLSSQTLVVLGTAQDGGRPQLNCDKACCANIQTPDFVSSLGLIQQHQFYLLDATPNMVQQVNLLKKISSSDLQLAGIFLTHAHIGHYTGLMYLGREALNAKALPVYSMPRFAHFLASNGPWGQLIDLNNIVMNTMQDKQAININDNFKIIPLIVPHRDEYSETVGYKIIGAKKTALYIPDIDKWQNWDQSIVELVKQVDYAFIDGTFFAEGEINRPMSEVPHPFISETIQLFQNELKEVKNKVHFIHLNHTNPMNDSRHQQRIALEKQGYHFAKLGEQFKLD